MFEQKKKSPTGLVRLSRISTLKFRISTLEVFSGRFVGLEVVWNVVEDESKGLTEKQATGNRQQGIAGSWWRPDSRKRTGL